MKNIRNKSLSFRWLPIEKFTGNFAIGNNIHQEFKIETPPNMNTVSEIVKQQVKEIDNILLDIQPIVEMDKFKRYLAYFSMILFFSPLIFEPIPVVRDFLNEHILYIFGVSAYLFFIAVMIGALNKDNLRELLSKKEDTLKTAKDVLKEYAKYLPVNEGKYVVEYVKKVETLLLIKDELTQKKKKPLFL